MSTFEILKKNIVFTIKVVEPQEVNSQYDFFEFILNGKKIQNFNGFIQGFDLRKKGIICKNSCIALDENLIFSTKESIEIVSFLNSNLKQCFQEKYVVIDMIANDSFLYDLLSIPLLNTKDFIWHAMYYSLESNSDISFPNNLFCREKINFNNYLFRQLNDLLANNLYFFENAQSDIHGKLRIKSNAAYALLESFITKFDLIEGHELTLKKTIKQLIEYRNLTPVGASSYDINLPF